MILIFGFDFYAHNVSIARSRLLLMRITPFIVFLQVLVLRMVVDFCSTTANFTRSLSLWQQRTCDWIPSWTICHLMFKAYLLLTPCNLLGLAMKRHRGHRNRELATFLQLLSLRYTLQVFRLMRAQPLPALIRVAAAAAVARKIQAATLPDRPTKQILSPSHRC